LDAVLITFIHFFVNFAQEKMNSTPKNFYWDLYILDSGLQILDLRDSARHELLSRTADFIKSKKRSDTTDPKSAI